MGPTSTYAFGQPVRFTWPLTRRSRYAFDKKSGYPTTRREWVTERYPGQPEPEPTEGIVIGVRWLANGENVRLSWEEGVEFRPEERFRAYLVAFDLHRRPAFVLPEYVEAIES